MAGRSKREQDVAAAMLAELQDAWAAVGEAKDRKGAAPPTSFCETEAQAPLPAPSQPLGAPAGQDRPRRPQAGEPGRLPVPWGGP